MTALLVPLKQAERLFVALSVTLQEIERESGRDTANLHLILGEYEKRRNEYLRNNGWFPSQIKAATTAAAEELIQWLESRAEQSESARKHLEEWEAEFNDHP